MEPLQELPADRFNLKLKTLSSVIEEFSCSSVEDMHKVHNNTKKTHMCTYAQYPFNYRNVNEVIFVPLECWNVSHLPMVAPDHNLLAKDAKSGTNIKSQKENFT